ncbi:replication endonuclease [Vibrio amylolyticus]|uniref:replication endonuclease n=1 Tax=Vibrio amylolyticus TaxID=2847292 RepID=UPI0038B62DBC
MPNHYTPVLKRYGYTQPINPDVVCIERGYQPASIEPDNINFIERDLLDANPRDHEWRKQFFANLPHYLGKYFAKRYEQIGENQGYAKANIYLREKMQPAVDRVRMVLAKYKHLPSTQKVALLSDDSSDENNTNQNDFAHGKKNQQQSFNFEQAEKNRKPVTNRLLAELEPDELKAMANIISDIVSQYHLNVVVPKYQGDTEEEIDNAAKNTYEDVAKFITMMFGIVAPRKYKKQTPLSALNDLSRMIDEKWWLGKLIRCRKIMREHLAIAIGQVSFNASAYASWDCIREHKEQQKRNWDAIQNMLLTDEETGEEIELKEMILRSVSNPAIRRHELMARCRGCEDIGNELGLQGLFLTLTTPAKYHNSYKKGGFIDHWNGASPREAQAYLNNVWQRIRAKLGREEIRWFGVRVAEPHHDGTPHWHLLIWVKPEDVAAVREIFISYATKEDKEELQPSFDRNEKRAAKKKNIQGPMNYKARCDFGYIDPEIGSATGYIAKYISKNIDGYAMDGEMSDETGKPVAEMAKNVSAWKSRWAIRQFQFFGGAPVTTYRELRRFANQNKAAFMDYLFQLNYQQLVKFYDELEVKVGRKFVGAPIPVSIIKRKTKFDSKYLINLLGDIYQPTMENDNPTAVDVMKAADHGNWHGYIMGQGGPFVARENLLIRNCYEVLPFASPHGEDVRKLEGFDASGVFVKTRIKTWTIGKKKPIEEAEEALEKRVTYEFDKKGSCPSTWKFIKRVTTFEPKTAVEGGALDLHGTSGSSRSSVNNCTEPEKTVQVRELSPLIEYEISRLIYEYELDDSFREDLFKGHWISLSKEKSIKLRLGETERTPDNLVYHTKYKPDLSWLGETVPIPMVNSHYQPLTQDNYQQPDLAIFSQVSEQTIPWADYINQLNQENEEWPIA